jgi:hypothetical protein
LKQPDDKDIRLLLADKIILNPFLVKLISKLIILLFLFLSYSSMSQSRNNSKAHKEEAVNTRIPINSNKYNKIQAHQSQPKQAVFDKEYKNQNKLNKVKSERVTPIQKSLNGSILDRLIVQYWSVQNEIKKAKKENNLERIIDLEKSSLACRNKYILTFENLENQGISREQEKLYLAFKKDFDHE